MYIIIINNYLYIIVSKYVSLVKKKHQILRKYVFMRKEDLLYNYNKYLPHFYSHGSLVLQTWFVAAICELN